MLVNTIKVDAQSPLYTYYCTLEWNAGQEGGGYCGIQDHPSGHNFIYSIWDPIANNEPITTAYTGVGTNIESFGGEGTGLKSWNFNLGWNTEQWYSFVTKAWNDNGHTMFGYWIYKHTENQWFHLVTMDYPVPNVKFNSRTGSFIEDWLGNGSQGRGVSHKYGWKRKTSDSSWNPLTQATFERVSPDAGAINYINNYNGGVGSDFYFMKTGAGNTPTTNTSGAILNLNNTLATPNLYFQKGEVNNLSLASSANNLNMTWQTSISKAPQFSYHVKIYDNSSLSGTPLLEVNNTVPHQKEYNLNTSSLTNNNTYYVKFYIIDIFGNESDAIIQSFTKSVLGINEANNDTRVKYFPNPTEKYVNIEFNTLQKSIELETLDASGKLLLKNSYNNVTKILVDFSDFKSGVYFIKMIDKTGKNNEIFKIIKK
nr:DUF3472 domain-containing protein [Chryseobacterium aquaeductus]